MRGATSANSATASTWVAATKATIVISAAPAAVRARHDSQFRVEGGARSGGAGDSTTPMPSQVRQSLSPTRPRSHDGLGHRTGWARGCPRVLFRAEDAPPLLVR